MYNFANDTYFISDKIYRLNNSQIRKNYFNTGKRHITM